MIYCTIKEQGEIEMSNIMIRESDQVMMSLVHFLVTKENYAPIQVRGVKDEIWLENLDTKYRIIRISTNRIINEEQFNFDILKIKQIVKQIKRKTLSLKAKTLNICLDLNDKIDTSNIKDIDTINIETLEDLKENDDLNKIFPELKDKLIKSDDNGLDLFINATNDINEKTEKENKMFVKVFSPKKLIFTKMIIAINILVYIWMVIKTGHFLSFTNFDVLRFGANSLAFVKSGEIYRILAAAFIHGGLIHLLVNMYSLAVIGSQVESFIGKWKFVVIYFISAICGNLLSLIFLKNAFQPSVGASGAIFGLMGSLLYFGYHYRLYLSDAIKNQIVPIIILNLVISFAFSNIDAAAHIGGLIGGYLTAQTVGIKDKSHTKDMVNGLIVLTLYVLFLSFVVFFLK